MSSSETYDYENEIEQLEENLVNQLMSVVTINKKHIGHAQFSLNGNVTVKFNIEGKHIVGEFKVPEIFCKWIKETYNNITSEDEDDSTNSNIVIDSDIDENNEDDNNEDEKDNEK